MKSSDFDRKFEAAIRLLSKEMPDAEVLSKSVLFHSIRVGAYLYSREYAENICLAGILHDAIEDTPITYEQIESLFGKEVASLVQANTKDPSLKGIPKYEELLRRCTAYGENAAIIKAADILDNHRYFMKTGESDRKELMKMTGTMLLHMLPHTYKDLIFDELQRIIHT